MKRKWVIWGIVILVVVIAALVIAERQRAQRTGKYLDNLPSDDYESVADAMNGLVSRGGSVVPQLLRGLSGRRGVRFRWRTVEVLGAIRDARAVDPLAKALKDPKEDPGVRAAAATALGKIRDPNAVQPLTDALQDEEPSVQIASALALADFGDASAVPYLIQLSQRSTAEEVAKAEAAKARLEKGTEAAKPPATAAKAAEPVPPPDKRFEVREAVTRALGRMADKPGAALSAVTAALDDPNEAVRTAACEALGQLRQKDSVSALSARLRDVSPDVATAAAWALSEIDDPSAADELKRAVGPGAEYWERIAAEQALKRRGIKTQ